jgi:putative toxin-antitoxin system antitoxin component (TIGR02293 family)
MSQSYKTNKGSKPPVLKEAAAIYKTKSASSKGLSAVPAEANSILRWLGGPKMVDAPIQSDFDIINAGAKGITKASIDALTNNLGISRKTMAEDIFDISVKTMERKASKDRLDKKISSHALEIAKLLQHAFEVFEDEEKMKRWLNRENRALNHMKPIMLFDTLTGLGLVNTILGRIEEGVYS